MQVQRRRSPGSTASATEESRCGQSMKMRNIIGVVVKTVNYARGINSQRGVEDELREMQHVISYHEYDACVCAMCVHACVRMCVRVCLRA